MRGSLKFVSTIFAFCLLPISAHAEMTVTAFLADYDAADPAVKPVIAQIVQDTENGLGWANSFLITNRKETHFYCVPSKLALTGVQLLDILHRESVDEPHLVAEQPLGLGMLYALQKVFPCPK
jgi:hypothetical protein